jgi:RNA polymerase sigma factor (sigma-70 family)
MSENDPVNNRNQHRRFWEKTCEDFKERLTAQALRFTNGRIHDAEDLVQGTICRILTYPRNPEKVNSPIAYLLRIMRNLWSTNWRKKGSANMESLDELLSQETQQKQRRNVEPAIEPDALRILENSELMAEMRVKKGPLTHREGLLLALHLEGYTCKEIAAKWNEDVRLVRSDLNAVRTKVRNRLIKAKRSSRDE